LATSAKRIPNEAQFALSCPEEFDDDEDESAVAVRFTVTVTRAGKNMVFTCLSEDAVATVEAMTITEGDSDTTSVKQEYYQGPEFSELSEDLQEAFNNYVKLQCGVDSDVAAFISMYSDYKEQKEYIAFLKAVQEFVQ